MPGCCRGGCHDRDESVPNFDATKSFDNGFRVQVTFRPCTATYVPSSALPDSPAEADDCSKLRPFPEAQSRPPGCPLTGRHSNS
jgi:hypothetical protein